VLACRSTGRGEELAASFRAEAAAAGAPPPSLEVAALDLSSLNSVRAFAAAWDKRADGRPLGALVNNAGIFDMGSSKPGRDDRGHEAHWGTNFLVRLRRMRCAHALCSCAVLP
jgi:NAD(P)-dependent dehydrogenase (short-subunit alcohol dehydrogenase family)